MNGMLHGARVDRPKSARGPFTIQYYSLRVFKQGNTIQSRSWSRSKNRSGSIGLWFNFFNRILNKIFWADLDWKILTGPWLKFGLSIGLSGVNHYNRLIQIWLTFHNRTLIDFFQSNLDWKILTGLWLKIFQRDHDRDRKTDPDQSDFDFYFSTGPWLKIFMQTLIEKWSEPIWIHEDIASHARARTPVAAPAGCNIMKGTYSRTMSTGMKEPKRVTFFLLIFIVL